MAILDLVSQIRQKQNANSGAFLMSAQEKQDLNTKLFTALNKENLNRVDDLGNNLLHHLLTLPEPPFDCVRFILSKAPYLANNPNYAGELPCDFLWKEEMNTPRSNRPIKALLCTAMDNSKQKQMLDRQANISLLRRFSDKDTNNHYEYITLDESDKLFCSPTLLCFSGRYTFNSKEANAFGKLIRQTLGIAHTDTPQIQTLSAWYPGNTFDLANDVYGFISPYIDADVDSPIFYINRFVHRYFRPLYTDKNGRKLPTLKAAKNMRMINMIGYSFGASVIQMISNALSKDMLKTGFSAEQSAFIQSQIATLTIGYYANPNNYKNHFNAHHLIHLDDGISYNSLSPIIDKKEVRKNDFYISTLKEQANQKIFIANNLNPNSDKDPHSIKHYFEADDPTLNYMTMSIWKDAVLINALNNSIQNTKSPRFIPLPKDLTKLPDRIEYVSGLPTTRKITPHKDSFITFEAQKIRNM